MALCRIVAYNVGFGECLLLKFSGDNQQPRFLLLDCGSKDKINWKAIADDITAELGQNYDSINFMLSHLHDDHYNGFNAVYDRLQTNQINPKTCYINADPQNDDVFQSVRKKMPNVNFIGIGQGFSLNALDPSINVLFPPAPITDPLYNYISANFFYKYCQKIDHETFYPKHKEKGIIDNLNFFSIVFETTGTNGKKYLFTGDAHNNLQTSYKLKHPCGSNIGRYVFDQNWNAAAPYKMVKMPHHGTKYATEWAIPLINNENGYMLISWDSSNGWADLSPAVENFKNILITNGHKTLPYKPQNTSQQVFRITIDIDDQNADCAQIYDMQNHRNPPVHTIYF